MPIVTSSLCAARGQARGSITAEALFGIFALLALTSIAAIGWSVGMDALKKRAVANQLQDVAEAARIYARVEGLLEKLGASPGTVESATIDELSAGVIPPASSVTPLTNAWGQKYAIYYYVVEKTPATPPPAPAQVPIRQLVALVLTTGGEAMDELAQTAAVMAGGGAGVIIDKPAGSGTGWVLRGVGNGYELTLGNNLTGFDAKNGHLGYYASLDDTALGSDVLYRVAVPGRPELNQMSVDLDMSGKNITDVKSVQFNATTAALTDLASLCGGSGDEGKVFFYNGADPTVTPAVDDALIGLYACRGGKPYQILDTATSRPVRNVLTVTPSVLNPPKIAKPACADGETPFISVSPASMPGMDPGVVGYTVRTYYKDVDANDWSVHMDVLDTTGGILTPLTQGAISVITSCTKTP